jgi:O-antigen ligase
MVLLGITAVLVALRGGARQFAEGYVRYVMISTAVAVAGLVMVNFETLQELLTAKLLTTQVGDSASEGGTIAARWGFFRASLLLATQHPIFGVGISNYETAYATLQAWLGDDYWATDNPHSAWLYILACSGFPALFAFVGIVIVVLNEFGRRVPLQGNYRVAYVGLVSTVILASGFLLLHLLTQYFFWFFAGVVYGWRNDAVRLQ